MRRIGAIVGICMIVILPPAGAQSSGASTSLAPWCTINPDEQTKGRFVELGSGKIHIVEASKQANAQQRLSDDAFVKIKRQEASQLVKSPAELSAGGNDYLVRASAFYVDDDYNVKSQLEAYFYSEGKELQIVNTSLSHRGLIPKDFAIVVETSAEIQKAVIICLTAE